MKLFIRSIVWFLVYSSQTLAGITLASSKLLLFSWLFVSCLETVVLDVYCADNNKL